MNQTIQTYGGKMSGSVEKAKFISEIGNQFEVQFNPTDIQLNATASWEAQNQQGNQVLLEFKNVAARRLNMTLIFDTTSNNENVAKTYVNHLLSLFELKELPDLNPEHEAVGQGTMGLKMRNALVDFQWGDFTFFGALANLNVKYTMFSAEGHPIRAEVKVNLVEFSNQWKNDIGGSRSNVTIPQVQLVQLKSGQTLSSLASMAGMAVGALAAMNGISDPMNVPPGQVLMLPGRN